MRTLLRSLLVIGALTATSQAQLVVTNMSATGGTNLNTIKPYLRVQNQGTSAVDLSKTTLDYLIYESGLQASSLVAEVYYISIGSAANLTVNISNIPLQQDGSRQANLRIRLGFQSGQLPAGQTLEIQWGLHQQGYQYLFNESDDWSFTSANGQWNTDTRVAVGSSGLPVSGPVMAWKGIVSALPANGTAGDVIRSQTEAATFVYDGTSWVLLAENGKEGATGPQGSAGLQGPAGIPGAAGAAGPQGPAGTSGTGTVDVTALQSQITSLQIAMSALTALVQQGGASGTPTTLTDARDGQVYKIVKIGTQTWMAQNLNYGGDAGTLGACYDNDPTQCATYGRLYDWATAMGIPASFNSTLWGGSDAGHKGICPTGWHVPSDAEWAAWFTTVAAQVGGGEGLVEYALMAASGWNPTSSNGSDVFGFRVLPAGYHYDDGTFQEGGHSANFWSSSHSVSSGGAWSRNIGYGFSAMGLDHMPFRKSIGLSLRCAQD